jgi:dolichol-phosphate mannosyltransferase
MPLANPENSLIFCSTRRLDLNIDMTVTPKVTIVVPTYKEAESLPYLIDRVSKLRLDQNLDIEMMIMDDQSDDGSAGLIALRHESWVRFIVRTSDRGLSRAVLDGMRRAQSEFLVCMDADLSHPPEAIPDMISALNNSADLVVGSRYVSGGSTSEDWGFLRWINSQVATLLARPLTDLHDPMSGFFALRRITFESGREFDPVGYKIGLEILVKCSCKRVVEIPIHFENRRFGRSKLTIQQKILYLRHLYRLYVFKYRATRPLTRLFLWASSGRSH